MSDPISESHRVIDWVRITAVMLLASCLGARVSATDPLRTILVVNGDSNDSLTIANHYADLREISDLNVVVLGQVPATLTCTVDQFRDQILSPLLQELDHRGLGIQADSIAYSAAFPTAIDISKDLDKLKNRHKIFTPWGSINGLTTLYQFVLSQNPEYVSPLSNYYSRRAPEAMMQNPFLGSDRKEFDDAHTDANALNFDVAISKLEALVAKHPQQWPLRFQIATWMNQAGRSDESIAVILDMIKNDVGYRTLFEEEPAFESLQSNPMYQAALEQMVATVPNRMPAVPFSARTTYGLNGLPLGDRAQGVRFLMSTVLSVTQGRGTTLAESINHLQRAASADSSGKAAEFYFSGSSDVRSTTRQPLFSVAATSLREFGHEVIMDQERLPQSRKQLMGAMLGSANYNWDATNNEVLPGAILENLTSTSGVLHAENGQTAMTDLIRGGAAGTSGTVTEPYALPFKFPTPMIFPYYASGCSLAEAFHLSVESPYQLLILGDPLCRPYGSALVETFSLETLETADEVQVNLKFWSGFAAASQRLASLELFVDGKLVNVVPPTQQFTIKKQGLDPGVHQLHIAAVSQHPLQLKSIETAWITVGDSAQVPTLAVSLVASNENDIEQPMIQADFNSIEASQVAIRHLGRRIVQGDAPLRSFKLPITDTGQGPVQLIPEALIGNKWVRGKPVSIDVHLAKP